MVAAGGQVSSREVILGSTPGSTGAATITGPGSRWTIESPSSQEGLVIVGGPGGGTLTVADGGQVNSRAWNVGPLLLWLDGRGDDYRCGL